MKRSSLPLEFTENVFVLGSGPGSSIPDELDDSWSLVSINASQAVLKDETIVPDFTLFGTSTLRNKPTNREAKDVLRGRKTRTLILFDREKFIDNQRYKLFRLGYSYDRVIFLSTAERLAWIRGATGIAVKDNTQKPSNGVAAVFLCVSYGVKKIVMTGFSLTKQGHAYNNKNRERAHVRGDRAALRSALMRGHPIYTNQADFSEESGVPLI
ncbi:hypothetical protein [Aliirhizobium cellulosilyticum]|uniref:Membrane-anchored protein n=1 Tax=Aliirhizobium cellulosilyticum TaxID=393664 RepID=A0A7W6TAI0_9HYPH|nr:hypothetical protein [Rhizobium cellulosilyticum]MBB4347922.1 hypothetical protein [Rhizobium cellulosilyticum]MBB4409684.1 hypothetical protein [Rhizobium cellulosilyticum]MBB4444371.1 hypothetical protein [Rhizobium cellulosilyticum]